MPSTVTASGGGTFCGSTTITAANGGSGTIYFQGTTEGGTSTAIASASQVISTSGTYYFRALSSSGCWSAEGSVTVTINPLPSAIGGTANVCVGSITVFTNNISGGTWSSSNGNALVDVSGNVTGAIAGTATIAYTLGSGCSSSAIVTVNPLPVDISGPSVVCLGTTATFNDISGGGTWSSGNSYVATIGTDGLVTGLVPGNANISYTLNTGCYTSVTITVNPAVSGITGATSICMGTTTTLVDASGGGTWTSTATGVATIDGSGDITGISAGTTNITYTLPTGCIATTVVTVNPISAVINVSAVCVGSTITLSDATTGGSWSSNNTSIATVGATGLVAGISAGTTGITYVTASGCTASAIVTVNPAAAAITGNTVICVGLNSSLTDAGGGVWSSSNTLVATIGSSSALVTGTGAGTAVISYTLATGCTTTTLVSVNAVPLTINGTTVICAGSITTLTDAVTGGTWSSSNTTVASAGSATGVITGVAGGTSIVTYSMAGGCYVTTTVTVNTIQPVNGILSACIGSATSLSDASAGGTWSSSNPSIGSVGSSGIVTGISVGSVNISYTLLSGCVRTVVVAINTSPSAISGPSSVCAGSTITLSDASTGGTWSSFSNSVSVGSSTGIVTGSTVYSGTATITYTAGAGCTVSQIVTVNPVPIAIGGSLSECAGTMITLTDATPGGTWSGTGDLSVATVGTNSGTVTGGASAGTGTVTYTIPTGCYITATNTVLANPVAIAGTFTVCVGSETTLTDATPGVLLWSSSNTAVAVASGFYIGGVSAGTATITYQVTSGCIATQVVTVNGLPAVNGNTAICAGTITTLSDLVSGGTWSSNNTSVATIGSGTGVVSGVAGGNAVISYTASGGCSATATVTVNPILAITGTKGVCETGTTNLSDATAGGTWSSSNISIATIGSSTGLVIALSSAGTSTITYSISSTGCSTTTIVSVNPQPGAILGRLSLCANAVTTLSDAIGGGAWSIRSSVATVGSASGIVTASSAYTGTATVSYATGSCVATAILTVNPNPNGISGPVSECAGVTITLSDVTTGGTWSGTGNISVATVGTNSGTVTAGASAGSGTVTYTITTGCYSTLSNTVLANPVPIQGTFTVCAGSVTTLTDATSGVLQWSSSNTTVATAAGFYIAGHAAGTATITYEITSGCIATQVITVDALPVLGPISGTLDIAQGTSTTLTDATGSGVWSSSSPVIAVVGTTGLLTGVNPGNTTISYKVTSAYGCIAGVAAVATVTATGSAHHAVEGLNICVGGSATINDVAAGGTWSSSNSNIATVDDNGMVTGLAAGNAMISYIIVTGFGTSVTTMPVLVNGLPGAVTISANPGTAIAAGQTLVLTATGTNDGPDPGYQWLINGAAVEGATSIVFTSSNFTDKDAVTCEITSSGACGGVTTSGTVGISVGKLGISNNVAAAFDVQVFPNPNKGVFTLKGSMGTTVDEEVSVEITDILGQVIYKNNVVAHNGMINENILLSGTLANGMYMLNMRSETGNKIFHFVIDK